MLALFARLVVVLVLLCRAVFALSSVAHINSSTKIGNFVTVSGYALNPESPTVYQTVQGNSSCNCLMRCFVDPACLGVSYDAFFLCSFNNVSAMDNNSSMPSPGSTSIFWTVDVAKATFTTESDMLVYAFIDLAVDWSIASETCAWMPGFQLAEFTETGQEDVAKSTDAVNGDQWMGLKKTSKGALFVNSQKAFAGSALSSALYQVVGTDETKPCFFLHDTQFKEDDCDKGIKYLCQSKIVA